jgi:hypothetical protein
VLEDDGPRAACLPASPYSIFPRWPVPGPQLQLQQLKLPPKGTVATILSQKSPTCRRLPRARENAARRRCTFPFPGAADSYPDSVTWVPHDGAQRLETRF